MRPRTLIALIGTLLISLIPVANAQNPGAQQPAGEIIDVLTHTPPRVYEGQSVVRVRTTSQAQLDALIGLVTDVWSERTGVGVLEVQIDRNRLPALADLNIPHDVLIGDLQAHVDAGRERIAEQTRIERRDGAGFQRGGQVHDESWFSNYRQLAEIQTYIDNIADLRPGFASVSVIGQSWEGRDMHAITISGPDTPGNPVADRPAVFIFSTVHAREWIAPMTTTYIASRLVADYDTDPRVRTILDNTRIIIVPIGNPDGYLYTWSNARLWRKTRRDNGNGTYGVDINRNWGYEWGGQGSAPSTASNVYHGTEPFSEPETRALRDVALDLGDDLIAHIDYHSYSQLIMWPFGYADGVVTPEPDAWYFEQIATAMADDIGVLTGENYIPQQSVDLYPAAGDSCDWFYGELEKTSFIIELRPRHDDFGPPPNQILPCAQENYSAFKLYVERVTEPFALTAEPRQGGLAYEPLPVQLSIRDPLGRVDRDSVTLWSRHNSDQPFEPTPASFIEHDEYQALIPLAPCDVQVEYYFEASSTDGFTLTFPRSAPQDTIAFRTIQAFEGLVDAFETDTDWTVGGPDDTATAGIWSRGEPQPVFSTDYSQLAQPHEDHTPDGTICWVTDHLAGAGANDRDLDGGRTTLTSPPIDLSAMDSGGLVFAICRVWFYTDEPFVDTVRFEYSNDNGTTWTLGQLAYPLFDGWQSLSAYLEDFDHPSNAFRVRIVAEDVGQDSHMEVAVDDVRVVGNGCPAHRADFDGDGRLTYFDLSAFLQAYIAQEPAADFNNDGAWTFFDISAFLAAFTSGI